MMNPNESDAGPPHKKPKILGPTSHANGLTTQLSESTEITAIENLLPDDLLADTFNGNQQQQQPQQSPYVNQSSINMYSNTTNTATATTVNLNPNAQTIHIINNQQPINHINNKMPSNFNVQQPIQAQQQTYQIKTNAVQQSQANMLKTGANSTVQAPQQSATSTATNQNSSLNTTFHNVGNVNINNINIMVQPNNPNNTATNLNGTNAQRFQSPVNNTTANIITNPANTNVLNRNPSGILTHGNTIVANNVGVTVGNNPNTIIINNTNRNLPNLANSTNSTNTTLTNTNRPPSQTQYDLNNRQMNGPAQVQSQQVIVHTGQITNIQTSQTPPQQQQQQQQLRPQVVNAANNKQAQPTQNVLVNSTTNNANSTTYPVVNQPQYSTNQVMNMNGPSMNSNQIMVNSNNSNPTTMANTANLNTTAINIPNINNTNNMNKQVVVNTNSSTNVNTNAPTNPTNANTNANNMRTNSTNPVNEQEKRKLIQQQLILLLHAHKCAQRADRQCTVPHCSTMREVLAHMVHCTQGRNCEMTHCASSRQIIAHWKNCQRPECPVCQPLRNSNQQTQALPNSLANNTANSNNTTATTTTTTTTTTTNSNDLSMINNANTNQNTTNSTTNSTFSNQPNTTQTNQSQQSASVLLLQQPQQPRVHKPWHENINAEMRRHLVQKIIQTIFPTSDPNIYGDPRLSNLINYATKTEREMYEQAQDQEEYFHLLAERIYKIQKEFEDKQRAARTNSALHNNNNNNNNLLNNNSNSSTSANGDLLSSNENTTSRLNDLSQFQNPLNPLNPYNPDLSAGNEGPPNRLAPISDSPLKMPARSVDTRVNQSNANQQAMNKSISLTSLNNFPSSSNNMSSSTSSSNINKSELELKSEMKSELAIKSEPNNYNENIKSELKSESISPNKYLIKSEPTEASSSSHSGTSVNNSAATTNNSGNSTTNGQLNTSSSTSNLNGPSSISPSKATSSTSASSSSSSSSNSTSTQESQSNVIATTTKGANNKPIIKFPSEYLVEKLMPILDRMYKEPDSLPFHIPVNPEELGLPDYFNVVKKPMDMSTIKKKLEDGKYANPQEFVDDTWLMFNNAWLYNKKTSRVYKSCTKLSEVFSSCIDSVMKEMGYCCGQQFTFMPQVMFCYGNQMCCTIPRDGVYYLYNNTDQGRPNVNCDKYTYCLKCFEGIKNETVPIGDDPSQPLIEVKKSLFVQMKNDHEEPEQYAECTECGRKWHQICALHMEQIFCKFVCDTCLREKKALAKKDNRYTSSKLQRTQLGDFLENRVNDFLKHSPGGDKAGRVTIRILSSVEKICEVKQNIKARFEGEITETFPFKTKAIFAFEEIDGTDVVFFGMHVQEYGSECAPPNTRRVYISYLDSVFFFRPKELRTAVYHEILIGYLDYVKRMGYQWAHIWACPPSEGDDYIFHCHPPEQKVPKPKRLQEWYRKMLDKGVIERVVIDYKDIHKDAIENGMKTPLDIPYFEGDFWPNVLEECIKESEQEEEKRRKEEAEAAMAAANEDFSTCGEDIYESNEGSKDNSNSNGKKKNMNSQQKKKNIKNKMSQRKSVKKVGSSSTDLMTKILSTMEKHKEVFFVIRLLDSKQVAQMGSIVDRDPLISCDLMNGRDEFLNFARDKHHEFSTLRRAKYSTMALLYELHNQASEKFTYTCNKCKMQMEVRYHCTVCEDFDLCVTCYETRGGHEHRMERLAGAGSQDADSSNEANKQNQQDFKGDKSNMKPQKAHIEIYLKTFMHAINCRNANCTYAKCSQFKRIVQHSKQCPKIKNSQCDFCRQLLALCIYHAKSCKEDQCTVPFCSQIKLKLKQQKAFNSQAERRRMIMMNKTLRQSANVNLNADSPKEESVSNASNGPSMNPTQLVANQSQMMVNPSGPHSHQMLHSMSTNNMANGQHLNMVNAGHHPQQQQQQQQQSQQQHHLMHSQSQPQMSHYPAQPPAVQINLPSTNHHIINNNASYQTQQQQQQPQQMQQYPIKQQPQMINNPSQISNTNSPQTNYNQNTFVNNSQINSQLVYSQQQQQSQPQTLLNSPNKQASHLINRNIGINQQQQQQPTANQQMQQQQQQSPQNFAQNTRIMNSTNITSPHPTPTTTPNPMNYNDMNSAQTVDTGNSWQTNQQYVAQNRNMQVTGGTGSPMTMTASPSPMQPMQQNPTVYQQVQQTPQQQPQAYGQAQNIQQPQQQQGMNNPGMENLIARFRQAQTPAERNQILQEINAINPAFYQRLQLHQQKQQQQQMMLNQQQQQQQAQPPQSNSNTMNINQQPQAQQQQQQWNHVYPNNANQQQQFMNNPQQQQQIRYNTPTLQQQQQQQQPGVNRQVIMNQPQQVVVQPQQNAQMIQQQQQAQRIGQAQPMQSQQLTPQQIQQQQQLNQQKLYQQRMMQQQQQQNMMNPIRPQQQQGQQQTMYMQQAQQPQQPMMNYKDAQMMNQTKDQMLLQAPNQFMSSPQNPQNPTDKLSQVVDNL